MPTSSAPTADPARRGSRRRARRAAQKWNVLGAPEAIHAGAEPLDGPALSWARATARELGIDLVAG